MITFMMTCKGDTLGNYTMDDKEYSIPFAPIAKYWEYANEEDVERAKMTLLDNGNLLIALTTASGQGGVVAVWDTKKHQLIHISEAAFAVAASVYRGCVYTLCCISHWGAKDSFSVTKAPLGTMDAWKEWDEEKITFDEYDGSDVDFVVTDREYRIIMHEKEYSIARQ